MRLHVMLLFIAVSLLAPATRAMAAPRHHDRPWYTTPYVAPLKGVPFSESEEEKIRAYFVKFPRPVASVSAFMRSAIRRAKPLPWGIAHDPAPDDLTAQLGPRPGSEILIVGRDIVLYETRRALVIDILRDVLVADGAG